MYTDSPTLFVMLLILKEELTSYKTILKYMRVDVCDQQVQNVGCTDLQLGFIASLQPDGRDGHSSRQVGQTHCAYNFFYVRAVQETLCVFSTYTSVT
jgi:hypothetical protein